jgi:hypothetical protein
MATAGPAGRSELALERLANDDSRTAAAAVAALGADSRQIRAKTSTEPVALRVRPRPREERLHNVRTAHRYSQLRWCDRFAKVIWTHGNRPLWTHPSDPVHCAATGVTER